MGGFLLNPARPIDRSGSEHLIMFEAARDDKEVMKTMGLKLNKYQRDDLQRQIGMIRN